MSGGPVSGGQDGGGRRSWGFGTRTVRGAGSPAGRGPGSHPHAPPLFQTSAFAFPDAETAVEAFSGSGEYIYTRLGNPTVRELERHVAALEGHPVPGAPGGGAEPRELDARFFASGMAAISAVALGVAGGGRLVCQDGIYGTTVAHMRGLRRHGMRVDFVPAGDLDTLRREVRRGEPPALVYIETPANPLLQLTEIGEAAAIAHEAGALLAVDATFATPALQRPCAWGADLSLHSTTKFMGGHGVVLGGVVTGRRERIREAIDPVRKFFGAAPDPFAAWLTLMGLRTLSVRMERHAANAAALARFLRAHSRVERVHYPDPSVLPAGQLAAGGPMVSFEVTGGQEEALAVVDRLTLATLAPTLGTVDTLVQHPFTMSHGLLPEERRRALGIGPGLLRVSVGLEDAEDILDDFGRALES